MTAPAYPANLRWMHGRVRECKTLAGTGFCINHVNTNGDFIHACMHAKAHVRSNLRLAMLQNLAVSNRYAHTHTRAHIPTNFHRQATVRVEHKVSTIFDLVADELPRLNQFGKELVGGWSKAKTS